MFEARLKDGSVLKKIVDAMKELVDDANLECSAEGIAMQAMDKSHVALVSLKLDKAGFSDYRADRNISLGLNLPNVAKILKCAGGDDQVTLKADDDGDTVSMLFESEDGDRVSDFEMKLMDIDSEHLGIPETDYKCTVLMPSSEFQRIIRDMGVMGDTCTIGVSKEGIRFTVKGDLGTGNVLRKQHKADKDEDSTMIDMQEATTLTFSLRYLNLFTKATGLNGVVGLNLSSEVPLMVEYKLENAGFVRFYLAPKIDDE